MNIQKPLASFLNLKYQHWTLPFTPTFPRTSGLTDRNRNVERAKWEASTKGSSVEVGQVDILIDRHLGKCKNQFFCPYGFKFYYIAATIPMMAANDRALSYGPHWSNSSILTPTGSYKAQGRTIYSTGSFKTSVPFLHVVSPEDMIWGFYSGERVRSKVHTSQCIILLYYATGFGKESSSEVSYWKQLGLCDDYCLKMMHYFKN